MHDDVRPPARPWVERWTWWVNTLALQGLIVAFSLSEFVDGYPAFKPIGLSAVIALVILLASILLRTKAPWIFLAVAMGLNFIYTLETPLSAPGWSALVALPFAVFAIASVVPLRVAVAAVVAIELLLVLTALIARGVTFPNIYPVSVTAFLTSSLALGQMTYAHRRLVVSAKRRAAEAERTREALAATRVAEQRLATARDLHDVVGHQIAVISLQAGVAGRTVRDAPDEAMRSLEVIESSAELILAEIGELLKELRRERADHVTEQPELADIRGLAQTLSAGGLPVDLHLDTNLPPLSRNVGHALYRILEEALVNAYKHGTPGMPATARVNWNGDAVLVRVSNPIDPRFPSATKQESTKLGIRGIHERAHSLGGHASVSIRDHVYELSVRLPEAQR